MAAGSAAVEARGARGATPRRRMLGGMRGAKATKGAGRWCGQVATMGILGGAATGTKAKWRSQYVPCGKRVGWPS